MDKILRRHNNARKRLIKMHYENKIGHIGGNLSCLDTLLVLHHDIIKKGDLLILSKGHSAGALYISLWSVGKIDESLLNTFHKDETYLSAHPSANWHKDIKFSTGSLGHGLSIANGIALSNKLKSNKNFIFCLTSDGEWQEGSMWEALIFACHQKLHNLVILVDNNGLQGYGSIRDISSMDDMKNKFSSFDLDIKSVDGHNPKLIFEAIDLKDRKKPLLIILETVKGFGIKDFENKVSSHYLPITENQYKNS